MDIGFQRSQPHIPIQISRYRLFGQIIRFWRSSYRGIHFFDSAYPSFVDHGYRMLEIFIRPLHGTDSQYDVVGTDGFYQLLAFPDGEGEWLFQIYVLLGLTGINGN